MVNTREIAKKNRIKKIAEIVRLATAAGKEIDKDRLISLMIVEHGISKKTALEEIEAVMLYDFK